MNDRKDAYKVGFLVKLAELGVTPNAFYALTKKAFVDPSSLIASALSGMGGAGKSALGSGISMIRPATSLAAQAAIGAPIAIGGASGIASAMLDAPKEENIELMRQAELLGMYRRLTEEINARRARKATLPQ